MARATVYRYFPNREALLEELGRLAVEEAGERLEAGRLGEVGVQEAFQRAVRALVAVGEPFVVVSRQNARPDPAKFERRIALPLRKLIERAQSLGEVRDDLPGLVADGVADRHRRERAPDPPVAGSRGHRGGHHVALPGRRSTTGVVTGGTRVAIACPQGGRDTWK